MICDHHRMDFYRAGEGGGGRKGYPLVAMVTMNVHILNRDFEARPIC